MKLPAWLKLIISLGLTLSAGFIGSIFTTPNIDSWYAQLDKPFFNPPNWIFGPVWTSLYILMAIALFLIWQEKFSSKQSKQHLAQQQWLKLFFIQLILNSLWSIIFFSWQQLALAFLELIILWTSIFLLIKKGKKLNQTASLLLIPYLAWVSFAGILNLSIWWLN